MRKSLQLYTMETRESICIGGCTSLTNGTIYFGISQYRCTVSGLPLFFIFIYIYIYMHECVCVCVCVIINIKVYYKTLPQFKTNYS